MNAANANLYSIIEQQLPADLDQIAVYSPDPDSASLTWRALDAQVARYAQLFASLGLEPGARVASYVDKSIDALLAYLGAIRSGFVYLPLNNAYQQAEIEYFLSDAQPSVIICAQRNQLWVRKLASKTTCRWVFTLEESGAGTLRTAASCHNGQFVTATSASNDLAAILYTSGTTGRSKGAMLTHENLSSNALTLVDAWHFGKSAKPDVLLHCLPIFHVHGLFVASHCALLSGSTMLWCNKFDATQAVQLLPQATVFMGVPTMYTRLLTQDGLTPQACSNMRLFVSGSAPLLSETFEQFKSRTGHTILERYGMSETVMLVSNPYEGQRIAGTVGQPLPGVQVRIQDDTGQACPTGQIGGIQVRGPNVFSGYWQMPEKTKEEFTADGWFKTGDVGKIDENGYVSIVGRSKDLIITGGYNVYPKEIESFLDELPGVQESAVIGIPHPDFGEAVTAVVIAREGSQLDASQLISTLKERIASYKVPKRIVIMPELPRNAMGKVQKNLLRQQLQN